jgi:hypothetical protein
MWFNDIPGLDNGRIGSLNYNSFGELAYQDGSMYDVRIFNKALSETERTNIFNSQDVSDGLIAHYYGNEQDGNSWTDISGNGYTGTVNGTLTNFHSILDVANVYPDYFLRAKHIYQNDSTSAYRVVDAIIDPPTISGYTFIETIDAKKYIPEYYEGVKIAYYVTPEMVQADTENVFFDVSENAQTLDYANIVAISEDYIFYRERTSPDRVDRLIIFSADNIPTGDCLNKIIAFTA